MAYHLTNNKAYKKACRGELTPVVGGMRFTAKKKYVMDDELGEIIVIEPGTVYRITGTKDSNGYVVSFTGDNGIEETHLIDAKLGVTLFE